MPKHSADPYDLFKVLEVYYEEGSWLSNKIFIEKLKSKLQTNQEPQAYTKKTQIHSYFGFIEWQDENSTRSPRRITESGIRLFKALKNNNEKLVFEELLFSLETRTFGKNVVGVSSDSNIEPPQLFIKCVLVLEYLTRSEFGYILEGLVEKEKKLDVLIKDIESHRTQQKKTYEISPKFSDVKPITIMRKWNFFQVLEKIGANEKISINQDLLSQYFTRLNSLKAFNDGTKFNSKIKRKNFNRFDYDLPIFQPSELKKKNQKQKSNQSNNNSLHKPKPTKKAKQIGDAGEKYVFEYEFQKLSKLKLPELANKIVMQSQDLSFFPGYDIQSYDNLGNKIYIEVKSSISKSNNFIITRNELNAAKKFGKNYFIYQVTNADSNPIISTVIENLYENIEKENITIEPLSYEVKY